MDHKKNIICDLKHKHKEYLLERYSCDDSPYSVRKRHFISLINKYYETGSFILDMGCGPGVLFEEVINNSWRYCGLDISIDNLFYNKTGLFKINGDMEYLPFKDNTFDIVIAMGAIEYLPLLSLALREVTRIIQNNGIFILSIPNKHSYYRLWSEYIYIPLSIRVKNILGRNIYYYKRLLLSKDDIVNKISDYSKVILLEKYYINCKHLIQPIDRLINIAKFIKRNDNKLSANLLTATEIILALRINK